jgi:hypothetical protein
LKMPVKSKKDLQTEDSTLKDEVENWKIKYATLSEEN